MAVFPKVVEGDDILKYVFPTKQKDVKKAIALAKEDSRIRRLIVFGSAITINCGMISDIDFAIDADITPFKNERKADGKRFVAEP